MIVKPTVEELLKHAENRYALVIETSKRARQISKYDKENDIDEKRSPVTIAANEIADGNVRIIDEREFEELKIQKEEREKQKAKKLEEKKNIQAERDRVNAEKESIAVKKAEIENKVKVEEKADVENKGE